MEVDEAKEFAFWVPLVSPAGSSFHLVFCLRIFISGGVGSIAVQIAKAEGAEVVATCASDAIPQIQALGVSHVVDYTSTDATNDLIRYGPYDIILDCAGKGPQYATEIAWRYQHYVTFTSPTLKNIDAMGLACGAAKNIFELVQNNIKSLTTQQGFVKWAYFVPAPHGIDYLKNLVDRNKVCPSRSLFLPFSFVC